MLVPKKDEEETARAVKLQRRQELAQKIMERHSWDIDFGKEFLQVAGVKAFRNEIMGIALDRLYKVVGGITALGAAAIVLKKVAEARYRRAMVEKLKKAVSEIPTVCESIGRGRADRERLRRTGEKIVSDLQMDKSPNKVDSELRKEALQRLRRVYQESGENPALQKILQQLQSNLNEESRKFL